MKFLVSLIILMAGYYSYSYGTYLWKNKNEKLAGFGVLLITLLAVSVTIIELYLKV